MDKKDILEYYWKYFELHSRQRMQMISFYITVEVALIGGFFVLLTQKNRIAWAEYCVLFAIGFISIVFWMIDLRTRELIHLCEGCIEEFEEKQMFDNNSNNNSNNNELKLMTKSRKQTGAKTFKNTYSLSFHIQFLVMLVFAVGCAYALYKGYI